MNFLLSKSRASDHATLWLRALRIDPENVTTVTRGFLVSPRSQYLESIGLSFLEGYHAALRSDPDVIAYDLDGLDPQFRGFGYEGAAMAYAIRDVITPWRSSVRKLLDGAGAPFSYLVHVGAGWALARLPLAQRLILRRLDPVLRQLAYDGCGFHAGYFRPDLHVRAMVVPKRFHGDAARSFDQGLGRSLWFVLGASATHIADTVEKFEPRRRSDLWSGVGLAAAYAGGVQQYELQALRDRSGTYRQHVAQGVAFAAEARARAGYVTEAVEHACKVFCGVSALEAAARVRDAFRQSTTAQIKSSYQQWRFATQEQFA